MTQQQRQDGRAEYDALARRTSSYPWATLATNLMGVGAAHAAGYYSAGAMTHALLKGRLGKRLAHLPPNRRKQLIAGAVGTAGTLGALAATVASTAGQVRVAEELARREAVARREGRTKTAHVLEVYRLAQAMGW